MKRLKIIKKRKKLNNEKIKMKKYWTDEEERSKKIKNTKTSIQKKIIKSV